MKTKTYRKSAEIHPLEHIRVIDGDTIEADILLPFNTKLRKTIRLRDFWADELDGPFRSSGLGARLALEAFTAGRVFWLHSPSCRMDKYGRVVGFLMEGDRLLSGREVLGGFQLTEAVHKQHRDMAVASRKQAKAFIAEAGRVETAEAQTKSLINDPGAKKAEKEDPAEIDAWLGTTCDDNQYGVHL